MTILLDQGTPAPLRFALIDHTVETAYERGWASLNNGALLAAAENALFDVFITTDQNLPSQQNLSKLRLAIIVLPTTRWPVIAQHTGDILAAVVSIKPGELVELRWWG